MISVPDSTAPTPRRPDAAAGNGLLASCLLALTGLSLFLLLPQHTLHGPDGNQFAVWIEQGHDNYPRHIAYLHVCGLIYSWLQPWGMTGFHALQLSSALGSAAALFSVHRAMRFLAAPGQRPLLLAVAVGLSPACFFYATCGEIPGVFAAGAGLSWWMFARWRTWPTARNAAALGLAIGLAGTLHSFGHILAVMFVLVAWALRALPRRGWLAQGTLLLLSQIGVAVLLAWWFGAGASGQARDAAHHLEERWRTFAPLSAPGVAFREWLLPYLPWSLLALPALCLPRARAWGLAALAALLVHLPFCVLLLGFHRIREDGAYLLPVAPAAVLAAALLLPRGWLCAAIAVAAAGAVWLAAPTWPEPMSPGYAAGVQALQREQPMMLVVGYRSELDAVRMQIANLSMLELVGTLQVYGLERERHQGLRLEDWFDSWCDTFRQMQLQVLFSQGACDLMAGSRDPELQAFWTGYVPQHYQLEPVVRLGFRGTWIRPRSGR